MEIIKVVKKQGNTRVFGIGGIKLFRESWMNQERKLKIIEVNRNKLKKTG